MQVNLLDYVKKYTLLEKGEAASIISDLEDKDVWQKHTFNNPYNNHDKAISGENEPETCTTYIKAHNLLMERLWRLIQAYINDIASPVFDSWSGFSAPKYIKYSKNQTMARHCDHIHTLFQGGNGVPILTIICALNDNYEGGKLMLLDEEYSFESGEIVIFPSNFMYPHEVTPVESGIRYSFAAWVY